MEFLLELHLVNTHPPLPTPPHPPPPAVKETLTGTLMEIVSNLEIKLQTTDTFIMSISIRNRVSPC